MSNQERVTKRLNVNLASLSERDLQALSEEANAERTARREAAEVARKQKGRETAVLVRQHGQVLLAFLAHADDGGLDSATCRRLCTRCDVIDRVENDWDDSPVKVTIVVEEL